MAALLFRLTVTSALFASAAASAAQLAYVKSERMCARGEPSLFQAPVTHLCNCGEHRSCEPSAGMISTQLTALMYSTMPWVGNDTVDLELGDSIPGSRRYYEDVVPVESGRLAIMSDGQAYSSEHGAVYIGTSAQVVTSGSHSFNIQDLLSPSRDLKSSILTSVCMVPSSTSNSTHFSCGAKRTQLPGHLKFSLYGFTIGDVFSGEGARYANGYAVFRQTVCLEGVAEWAINGERNGDGILGTNVSVASLSVAQQDGANLTITFQREYVFGDLAGCELRESTVSGVARSQCYPTGTKEVVITAAAMPPDACASGNGLSLHYAFETVDIATGVDMFWAYDPDVAAEELNVDEPAATPDSGSPTDANFSNDTESPAHGNSSNDTESPADGNSSDDSEGGSAGFLSSSTSSVRALSLLTCLLLTPVGSLVMA